MSDAEAKGQNIPNPKGSNNPRQGEILAAAWGIVQLPLQIVLFGVAIFVLLLIAKAIGIDTFAGTIVGVNATGGFVAFLVFLVGLSFAAFLWWLASRYFQLLTSKQLDQEHLAGLKDLPLALPEGTVRAVLALIVGVVGLPIFLFSNTLGLTDATTGYVNGIIAGVFGFYFGTRTSGVPTQAVAQITAANRQAGEAMAKAASADQRVNQAQNETAQAKDEAAQASRGQTLNTAVDQLQRHIALASTLVQVIGPALPPGMMPGNLQDLLDKAQSALGIAKTLTGDTATGDQIKQITDAATALIGGGSSGTSVIGSLISTASGLLPAAGLALGPVSGIALLLGVGWKLGSAEFQRWRARVLAAPFASGLVEFGTITPDDALASLSQSPIFRQAFAQEQSQPGFGAFLADAVLRDDAADRLWTRYGPDAPDHASVFSSRDELIRGLTEYRRILLEDRARTDISDADVQSVAATLAGAANATIQPKAESGALTADTANTLIQAAGNASAAPDPPVPAQAAFDALVTLVGHARLDKVDLPSAIAEIR